MQTSALRQLLALTMTVMLASSTTSWAAGTDLIGNLRVSGTVLANAIPLPDGSTVRGGDRIATRRGSLAVISSASHGRLEVRSDSEARLATDHVRLDHGAIAASRLPVEVDSFSIRPQDPARAWFAVAKRDGRLLIAAHRSNLVISATGVPIITLPEGSYATRADAQDEQTEKDKNEKDKKEKDKKKRGAAAAGAAGGWTIGSLSHGASVALVVGVGAGVAAAAAGAAIALSDETPSPSQ